VLRSAKAFSGFFSTAKKRGMQAGISDKKEKMLAGIRVFA